MNAFKFPWRIEARANPFVPWVTIEHHEKLEAALLRPGIIKSQYHFYSIRVRAN